MARFSSVALGLVLMGSGLAADDFKLEPGFKLLFNGKNLDGWKEARGKNGSLDGKTEAYGGRFKVVDGTIVYDPAVKGDLHVETVAAFGNDVHLKFDFKAGPKCNNDVFLRGTKFDIVPGKRETKSVEEGKWHTFEIVVVGDKIEHRIGSEILRSATLKAGAKATPFRLRAEFGVLEIKNIRVRE